MTLNQKIHLNALNTIQGVGYHTLKNLYDFFGGDFEAVFKAGEGQLEKADLRRPEIELILNERGKIDPGKEFKKLEKEGIRMITLDEKEFPRLLKEIHHGPIFLYVRGEIRPEDDFAFGIVGTRLATDYGKETTYDIVFKLSQIGLTVVSGMAYGIDSFAHQASLAAGGRAIAVLGSGIDDKSIYPQQNLKLAHKIIEKGALISEYSLGSQATKEKFIQRNRIISGLARGLLVVEAPLRSGSLITARYALEQNRDVFAVPGNIFSRMSFGTNLLIKQGATLVTRAEDILQELNIKLNKEIGPGKQPKPSNKTEEKIVLTLASSAGPCHADEIIRNSGLPAPKVFATLTTLEMKGIIKNLGAGKYTLPNMMDDSDEEEII